MPVVVLVLVSQLAPVAAVRPQEGWYVRDTMTYTVSGVEREYFIIDNKMSSQPWYIQFYSFLDVLQDPVFMTPDWARKGFDINWNVLGIANTWYRGFSDVDWCVDDDWLLLVDYQRASSSPTFNIWVFDKSKIPLLTFNESYDSYSITGPQDVLLGRSFTAAETAESCFGFTQDISSVSGASGSLVYRLGGFGQTSTVTSNLVYNPFFSGVTDAVFSVDGTSINDLCVVPFAQGFTPEVGKQGYLNVQLAISWAVPVDKCPAGTQVGDSWPKVKPLEVQMDDAYKAWMDSALQNTDYADSSNVGKDLKDYNDQLEASDNWGELATAGWAFVQPIFDSFDFVFVILGIAAVSFVLLLLIKKGMS